MLISERSEESRFREQNEQVLIAPHKYYSRGASRFCERSEQVLIIVCGLPGTGKTTIAQEIAKKIKASHLNIDSIRKRLFKKPKYTYFESALVYRVLFLIAEELLKKKINVVLDATFVFKFSRDEAKELAKKYKTQFKIIEAKCQKKILLKRIRKRKKTRALSDADEKVYFKIKKEFQPIKKKHFVIDNSGKIVNLKKIWQKKKL